MNMHISPERPQAEEIFLHSVDPQFLGAEPRWQGRIISRVGQGFFGLNQEAILAFPTETTVCPQGSIPGTKFIGSVGMGKIVEVGLVHRYYY
jgi:hypothetical protein